jgi:hypothetical protein
MEKTEKEIPTLDHNLRNLIRQVVKEEIYTFKFTTNFKKIVHEYLTQLLSDNKEEFAELKAVLTPKRLKAEVRRIIAYEMMERIKEAKKKGFVFDEDDIKEEKRVQDLDDIKKDLNEIQQNVDYEEMKERELNSVKKAIYRSVDRKTVLKFIDVAVSSEIKNHMSGVNLTEEIKNHFNNMLSKSFEPIIQKAIVKVDDKMCSIIHDRLKKVINLKTSTMVEIDKDILYHDTKSEESVAKDYHLKDFKGDKRYLDWFNEDKK